MKRLQGSCLSAGLVLVVGILPWMFITLVGGAMLVGIPPVSETLAGWVMCPDAVSITQDEYNHGPVTSNPNGTTGHQEEWTCIFADGSQRVVPNEEIAFTEIGTSFAVVGICSGLVFFLVVLIAAVIGGRLAKPKDA